jgi:hypothetical protein
MERRSEDASNRLLVTIYEHDFMAGESSMYNNVQMDFMVAKSELASCERKAEEQSPALSGANLVRRSVPNKVNALLAAPT